MIVLELLHLKMEITVSEPCDVIRVHVCMMPFNCSSKTPRLQEIQKDAFMHLDGLTLTPLNIVCTNYGDQRVLFNLKSSSMA